jgi:hypothetical protein
VCAQYLFCDTFLHLSQCGFGPEQAGVDFPTRSLRGCTCALLSQSPVRTYCPTCDRARTRDSADRESGLGLPFLARTNIFSFSVDPVLGLQHEVCERLALTDRRHAL